MGRSNLRTPPKHDLLNKMSGREAGVLSTQRLREWIQPPWVILDLCAGDGTADHASGTSSPELLLKHAEFARRRDYRTIAVFVERDVATYDLLRSNVPRHDDNIVIRGDSRDPNTITDVWTPNSAVFVHNDPNTVQDFALSDQLLARLPEATTTLSTLGCNAGGLKRLPPEARSRWYEHVERIVANKPRRHDACLIRPDGDASCFAWLLTGPTVWRDRYAKDITQTWDKQTVTTAWCNNDRDGFRTLCDELFLTRKERGQ